MAKGKRKHAEVKFTVKWLESLECPKGVQRAVWYDAEVRGLGVAVYPSRKQVFFHLRKVLQWVRRTTIGEFPSFSIDLARKRASELNAQLETWKADARDGVRPKSRRISPRLGELVEDYVVRRFGGAKRSPLQVGAQRKYDWSSAADYRFWILDRYLAAWRNRRVSTLSRLDVLDLHRELGEKHGGPTANRTIQFLKTALNHGIAQEMWAGPNPVHDVEFFSEVKRDRFLQPEEMWRLFDSLAKFEETEMQRARQEDRAPNLDLKDYVLLALFTGARKSDVLSMRWADITLGDTNTWKAPGTKTDTPYLVPLIPEAVAVLKERRARGNGSEWVFPSRGASGHVVDLKKKWAELVKAAEIPNIRQHDLRRSLGSWMAGANVSIPIIGRTLGHTSTAATQVYARLNLDPVRNAVMTATRAMLAAANAQPQLPAPASRKRAKAVRRG